MRQNIGRVTRGSLTLAAMIASILGTTPASADDQSHVVATAPTTGLEEIVVTARKEEELTQNVPVSLTAISAQGLEANAVLDVMDLQLVVPGLTIIPTSQGGAPAFAIRAAKADNGTSDTVTAYIDDVPVASTRSVANMMYDMQSITTLKGPQGTLFGANSTGGAIIFRPNKPTNRFEAYVQAGYGNYNRMEFEGMVNVPAGDPSPSASRAASCKPMGTRRTARRSTAMAISTTRTASPRACRCAGTPSDRFQNDLSVEYFKEDANAGAQEIPVALRGVYNYTTFLGGLTLPVNWAAKGITVNDFDRFHVAIGPKPTWNKADIVNVIEAASYKFNDDVSVKLVVGYQDLTLDTAQDNDATILPVVNGRTKDDKQVWTIEPSIDWSVMDGRLHNKTGLFYSTTDRTTGNSYRVVGLPFDYSGFGPAAGAIEALVNQFYPIQVNNEYGRSIDSKAIYSQFSYALSDTLKATVGLRYTKDTGDYTTRNFQAFGAASDPLWGKFDQGFVCAASINLYKNPDRDRCIAFMDMDSDRVSYNVSIEDQISEGTLVYAASRGGYVAGGFNNQANPAETGVPFVFKPGDGRRLRDGNQVGLATRRAADPHQPRRFLRQLQEPAARAERHHCQRHDVHRCRECRRVDLLRLRPGGDVRIHRHFYRFVCLELRQVRVHELQSDREHPGCVRVRGPAGRTDVADAAKRAHGLAHGTLAGRLQPRRHQFDAECVLQGWYARPRFAHGRGSGGCVR